MNGISQSSLSQTRLAAGFFLILCLFTPGFGFSSGTPQDSIREFISAMNRRQYRAAYSYISKPLQEQMTYGEFHDAARGVKSIRLLSIVLLRQTPQLAKARVMVESIERDVDNPVWEKRKHVGELVFIPEKGKWRVIQVDLRNGQKRMKKR